MPYLKRKRTMSSSRKTPYAKRARTASSRGRTGYANVLRTSTINNKVNNLYRMIETKEGAFSIGNVALPHNNVYLWTQNVLSTVQGVLDPMLGNPNRIGDQINVKGVSAKFFVEAALGRCKVNFRIMLLKGPRGATFTRADIFKGMSGNKLIDQMNTEKYSVLAQKVFNVSASNFVAQTAGLTGIPGTATAAGMTGNKVVSFWIPGRKFGKNGSVQFENGTSDPKFFDYRWVILAYDWYGTPQDVNNVGFLNECWSKLYFKDA